jgi:hypothetical protein
MYEAHITSQPLPLVRMKDWVKKLEVAAKGAKSTERKAIPALKLMPLFRAIAQRDEESWAELALLDVSAARDHVEHDASGSIQLAHAKALLVSKTLREENELDIDDARRWVGYWKKRGFFAEPARL